jgi:hypothetical protein
MLELAKKYFSQIDAKVEVDQVWYEPKMDIYYCRTKSGEYWQIPSGDLRKEAKLLKWSLPD